GLDAAHTALLDALLSAVSAEQAGATADQAPDIAIIGMGRYGGGELGFASDIDVIAVYRAPSEVPEDRAAAQAVKIVAELRRLVSDPLFPVDLDFDLRPEGKNGPLARSLDAYRSYYERWSDTWETQALLRARRIAGDPQLGAEFETLADGLRY